MYYFNIIIFARNVGWNVMEEIPFLKIIAWPRQTLITITALLMTIIPDD